MPLRSETVEWIFARMAVRYGASWAQKWAGIDMGAVAQDWMLELENMQPYAIKYAMGFLPQDFPPTAGQFRAICARAPDRAAPAIADGVKANPQRVSEILATLGKKQRAVSPRAWIDRLRAKERAGERLSAAQRHCLAQVRYLSAAPVMDDFYAEVQP